MAKRAAVTEVETKRAIKAALAAGLQVKEVVVTVDGTRILTQCDGEQPRVPDGALPKQWRS